jgi:flagellar basal-body rod protein FlgG
MYTAAAGMAAQQQRLDAVANDLANVNTTGYKHVRVAFRDLVYNDPSFGANENVRVGAGAAATMIGRSQSQGTMNSTGQALDVAVSGPGFIQVRLADGRTALTRDGALGIDGRGNLRMNTGALLQPPVTLPAGTDPERVMIQPDGRVMVDRTEAGRITLVNVPAPGALDGGPNNTFVPSRGSGAVRPASPGTALQVGVLEQANVDTAEAFTSMIESQRAFELSSRAIKTHDQMLEIANQVKRA